ncbi:TPA: DUF551 domain-containing protein [Yersinia enterocolitica]|nr:DUF551 domain-containing protein [Yersinia enterocolitica]
MKELDSFTVERLEEIIAEEGYSAMRTPKNDEVRALARIALAAKRAEPNELADAVNEFLAVLDNYPEQLVPINRNSVPVKDLRKALSSTPQLNSPEIPDYKSALLGLLTNRISKDHLGFFTLAGINKTNLVRAVEVSEAAINFENVPQVDIGECLIPNGWKITQDWIKCSDRLPDKSGDYLVACHYPEFYAKCWVMHVMDFCHTAYETPVMRWYSSERAPYIKYWMPLAAAPEK